jgi:hypothetical protein
MQVSASPTPKTGASAADLLGQMKQQAAILSDASTASDADKVKAYVKLYGLMYRDGGGSILAKSPATDRATVGDAFSNSTIAKRISAAANEFNAFGMSQDPASNVPRKTLAQLNSLPELEQQMIFAGTVPDSFGSLAEWKGQIEKDIVATDKMYADDKAAKGGGDEDSITLSDDAKAALEALIHPGPGDVMATAALKLLRNAAEARAKAKDAEADAPKVETAEAKPYAAGDLVDTAA